jgi:peptidoglycan/LPS O-acetylase OafA/YrhL
VWSLCVEEHFYLLFPLMAWWLARRPSFTKFMVVCAAVVLLGVLVRGFVWLHFMGPVKGVDQNSYNKFFLEGIYYPTWSRLDGLLAGVVLAVVKTYRPVLWVRWARYANGIMLTGLAVVGLAIVVFMDRPGFLATLLGYPLLSFGMGLLVFAGAQTTSVLSRLRVPGAAWLAAASYSLYLSHKAVFHLVESSQGARLDGHGVLTFMGYASAVLLVGAVLHYGVERPFLQLRERFLKPARAKAYAIGGVASDASTEPA